MDLRTVLLYKAGCQNRYIPSSILPHPHTSSLPPLLQRTVHLSASCQVHDMADTFLLRHISHTIPVSRRLKPTQGCLTIRSILIAVAM